MCIRDRAESGDKSFTLTWNACGNVTGNEVEITYDGKKQNIRVAGNELQVKNFMNNKLVNNQVYHVKVRSVNGTWASPYTEPGIDAIPKATKKPDPPDNIKATGEYRKIRLTWKNMPDTDSYNIFYKEKGAASYQKIEGVQSSEYMITELKDKTTYEAVSYTHLDVYKRQDKGYKDEADNL